MKKIGILTWHYHSNFGTVLQAYALKTVLSNNGYNVVFVNYRNSQTIKQSIVVFIKKTIGYFYGLFPFLRNSRLRLGCWYFGLKEFRQTKVAYSEDDLRSITSDIDIFICGSDQIWAPNVFDPVYMASFASKQQRKVSYAASIGLNDIPDGLVATYTSLLSDFYKIGVREQTGKDLLEKKCNICSSVVLDPTLLLTAEDYRKVSKRCPEAHAEKYLFCYFLRKNNNYEESVIDYAKKHALKIIGISRDAFDYRWIEQMKHIDADEFIYMIDHADAVVTDSYHGAIFSLLFHKNFWLIKRFNGNDPINQNSRINQLSNYFPIGNRIIEPGTMLSDENGIDYYGFESRLTTLRANSINFLYNCIR